MSTNITNEEKFVYSKSTRKMLFTPEELKDCLNTFYDEIVSNQSKTKLRSCAISFLSAGASGFITFIFSDAKSIGNIPAARIELAFIILVGLFGFAGIVLLAISSYKKNATSKNEYINSIVDKELNARPIQSRIIHEEGITL